jgi:hypothetical protein
MPLHIRTVPFRILLLAATCVVGLVCMAQGNAPADGFDTAYVRDFSHLLTVRAYSSTKYNKLKLGGLKGNKPIIYRPNNRINVGVGASYRALTLNLGVGIPGLNNDEDEKGETRYLDAQANIYTRHWATNLFLQRFQGYYISSHHLPDLGWEQATTFPTRPDLVQFNLGASSVYILNHDRFSYRAAFNQDAWQRKSQGSVLVGGYLTYFRLQADSSLVPSVLAPHYDPGLQLSRSGFLDLGVSTGYAYTLVLQEHLFLTGSFVVGAGLSAQRAITVNEAGGPTAKNSAGLGWHGQYRAAMGWNSEWYFVGLSFNQENIGYLLKDRSSFYWSVGNIRLNVAKRINARIGLMDRGIQWFRKKV